MIAHAEARKRRLVRAYFVAVRAGDVARIVAVRKAFWRLVDAARA